MACQNQKIKNGSYSFSTPSYYHEMIALRRKELRTVLTKLKGSRVVVGKIGDDVQSKELRCVGKLKHQILIT